MILDDCCLYGKQISSVFSNLVGLHGLCGLFQSLGSRPKECYLYTLMLILKSLRLNPCSNGISFSKVSITKTRLTVSLNPCSNGIPSDLPQLGMLTVICCLNPCSNGIPSDLKLWKQLSNQSSLNPCSNGIPSDWQQIQKWLTAWVLILVLMEYPLTICNFAINAEFYVLILVLMEYPLTWSGSSFSGKGKGS